MFTNPYTNKEYGKQFAISDSHYSHSNITKYDGRTQFMTPSDLAEYNRIKDDTGDAYRLWKPSNITMLNMEKIMTDKINSVVGENDTLWFLGDFIFTSSRSKVDEIRSKIVCKDIRMVWGNHDDRAMLDNTQLPQIFSECYDAATIYHTPVGTFDQYQAFYDPEVRKYLEKNRRNYKKFYCSHYCHAVWDGSHKGVIHLHGHSHLGMEPWKNEFMPFAQAFDVGGMGNDYVPYSFDQLIKMADAKAKLGHHKIDHHGPMKIVRDANGEH